MQRIPAGKQSIAFDMPVLKPVSLLEVGLDSRDMRLMLELTSTVMSWGSGIFFKGFVFLLEGRRWSGVLSGDADVDADSFHSSGDSNRFEKRRGVRQLEYSTTLRAAGMGFVCVGGSYYSRHEVLVGLDWRMLMLMLMGWQFGDVSV